MSGPGALLREREPGAHDGRVPPLFNLDRVAVERAGTVVLHDVCARIEAGRCTAVVGPSGAGKSTLLRLLDRLEEPTTGRITFHGAPLSSYDVLALRRRVGLVQQRPVLLAP